MEPTETPDVLAPSAADASVRPARTADLPANGPIHARAWSTTYRDLVPPEALPHVNATELTEAWRPWLEQANSGGPLRHLLVACTGPTVVGFAAFGPAGEPGAPASGSLPAELTALYVDGVHQRHGHGSRLLAAGVDLLREDGATQLVCWVPAGDVPRIAFLRSTGLEPDGAARLLLADEDAEEQSSGGVREVRLWAQLGEPAADAT
jgi:ribosomal protein S18 acetylase RimI-like enzyme